MSDPQSQELEERIPKLRTNTSKPKINIPRGSTDLTPNRRTSSKPVVNPFKIVPPTPVSFVKKQGNIFEQETPKPNSSSTRVGSTLSGWFGGINLAHQHDSDDETDGESIDFDEENEEIETKKPPKTPGATISDKDVTKNINNSIEGIPKESIERQDDVSYLINPDFSLDEEDEKKKKKLEKIKSIRRKGKRNQPVWYHHTLQYINESGNSVYGWYLTLMIYLWEIFEIQRGYIGKIVSVYMSVMVFFSLIGLYVWTDKILVAYNEWLFYIVFVCQLVASVSFTLDYLIRLLSCIADKNYTVFGEFFGRIYFILTINSLLDLFTLVCAVSLVIQITVRLTYQYPVDIVSSREKVLYDKSSELLTALSVMVSTIFIVAVLMYYLERDLQPEKLSTLFDSTYFAVVTLATIGYGDVSPVSRTGKMLTMIVAITAIALFTIPTSIIGSALTEQLQEESRKQLEKIKESQKKIGQRLKEFKQSEEQTLAAKMMGEAAEAQKATEIQGVSQSNRCPHCKKEITFITQISETKPKEQELEVPGESIFDYFRKSKDIPTHKRTISAAEKRKAGHKRTVSNTLDAFMSSSTTAKQSSELSKKSAEFVRNDIVPVPEPVKKFEVKEKPNRKISFDPKSSNFK